MAWLGDYRNYIEAHPMTYLLSAWGALTVVGLCILFPAKLRKEVTDDCP